MRRWLDLIALLLVVGLTCGFVSLADRLLSVEPSAAPAAYVGPGDVKSGATLFISLRAYSAATAGTKVINLCTPADAFCGDVNTTAAGDFDVAAASGGSFGCNNSTVICTIKTWYDKGSGGTDFTQATIAQRAILSFNCVNTSLPCAVFSGGGYLTTISTMTLPVSYTYVFDRTGTGTQYHLNAGNGNILSFSTANYIRFGGGSNDLDDPSVADSTWHSATYVYAATGNTSTADYDGSAVTASNLGIAAPTGTTSFGSTTDGVTNPYQGKATELGMWSNNGFSGGDIAAMCHNNRLYYGTGGAC